MDDDDDEVDGSGTAFMDDDVFVVVVFVVVVVVVVVVAPAANPRDEVKDVRPLAKTRDADSKPLFVPVVVVVDATHAPLPPPIDTTAPHPRFTAFLPHRLNITDVFVGVVLLLLHKIDRCCRERIASFRFVSFRFDAHEPIRTTRNERLSKHRENARTHARTRTRTFRFVGVAHCRPSECKGHTTTSPSTY